MLLYEKLQARAHAHTHNTHYQMCHSSER